MINKSKEYSIECFLNLHKRTFGVKFKNRVSKAVQEIRKFGVNQATALKLIELLALELESREKMLAIVEAVRTGPTSLPDNPVIER